MAGRAALLLAALASRINGMPLAIPHSRRFWVPREDDPDLSDGGFLVDPELELAQNRTSTAVPFESIGMFPVLGLLGEPGIGKSTALKSDHDRIKASVSKAREPVFWVDLSLYGSDALLDQKVFRSKRFRLLKGVDKAHIFFDGLDECLLRVPNIVGLLLEFLSELPADRLSLRIACRTADWPVELESGLREFGGPASVGVYQLSPLRRRDVRQAVEDRKLSPDDFLSEVAHLGAAPLASRPITLRFLLDSFGRGEGLPSRRTDLYREGCCVLCDEWRERRKRDQHLSSGLRFAVASRVAAAVIFGWHTAIWTAPRGQLPPGRDVRAHELLGRDESFERETIQEVGPSVMTETLDTGLFRSRGEHRLGFSHQTYAEYLAAQYLVARRVPVSAILGLIFHEDGSGKIVPQLRDTAAWLAAMLPEVCQAVLAKDPEAILLADDAPLAEADRAGLVRELLRAYDSGELIDERVVRTFGKRLDGARLTYPGLDADLKPYVRGQNKGITVRRVAILITELTRQTALQQDLLDVALSEDEPHEVRTIAVLAIGKIGDEKAKASLKRLATDTAVNDPDDELKGGALIATWPKHLTAEELFSALSLRKKPNLNGLYQLFFWRDIASHLQARDMCIALDWASRHANGSPAQVDPLRTASFALVVAAIDFFQEPGVCERLADILLASVRSSSVRREQIAAKLQANPDGRRAIASLAIRKAPDLWSTRELARMGLILKEDTPFLLSELNPNAFSDEQRKIGLLIRDILCCVPWMEIEGFDQVVAIARTNPALLEMLQPVLGPVEWPSAEAERLKAEYEAGRLLEETLPPPELPLQDELLAALATGDDFVFERACCCLLGDSLLLQNRDDELLPRWASLGPEIQGSVVESAAAYLRRKCPINDLGWICLGQLPYRVMFGFWALRLLSVNAPATFSSISE